MNNDFDYWEECISVGADECGLKLTAEQLKHLAKTASGGHENYGMAFGCDAMPNYADNQHQEELRKLKREKDEHEKWINNTSPCKTCVTTGTVQDGWGRNQNCHHCGGKGRR